MASDPAGSSRRGRRICGFSYALGAFTVLLFGLCLFLRAGHKLGYGKIIADAADLIAFWRPKHARVMDLPAGICEELARIGAVVENAGNPTQQRKHDTVLVQRDPALGWSLRPGARVIAHVLCSVLPMNLDPPALFLPADAELSRHLSEYVAANSRLAYNITVNADGLRATHPDIQAGPRLLIVGDSVAFGLGVDDQDTLASRVQSLVGTQLRVMNAGVGSYDGMQACTMARRLAGDARGNAGLVYVACQNDFMGRTDPGAWTGKMRKTLREFAAVAPLFNDRVVVYYHSYLQSHVEDLLLREGWSAEWLARSADLRHDFAAACNEAGFVFLDWGDLVAAYGEENPTLFSPFALYADQCHPSPLGFRLMAAALCKAMDERGWIKSAGETEADDAAR